MSKKILVTGGQWFVGNALLKELQKRGHSLTCLDCDLSKMGRSIAGIRYVNDETKNIKIIFQNEFFDEIYHLWEYSRVEGSYANIEQIINSNIHWTIEVINYWKNLRTCKLIYTASSTKFSIGSNWDNISPYAFSKANNVELIKKFWEWFDLSYAVTYFYNVYGPGENEEWEYATLIWILKKAMREGKKLPIVSPWTQQRNFTHISDIIKWLVLVWEKWYWDWFGIGSSEKYSILDVANIFGGEIQWLPKRIGNRLDAELVTDRTMELWWKPWMRLPEYIKFLSCNNYVDIISP